MSSILAIDFRNAFAALPMNLADADLNLLVAFDALMAERSVTRAARRLGMSQPGTSNALARLRRLFDDPLLVRDGTALVPTARAEVLLEPVRAALALVSQALDEHGEFDAATNEATFTISCSDYSLLMLVGPLVRQLAAEAPGVTIQVRPRAPDPVARLRDGTADLVIEPTGVLGRAALPSQRLFSDRWLCCVWAGNTQVGERLPLETYQRLGHIVYSMGREQPISLPDEHLSRVKVARRIEFVVENFLLAPFLLEGTELVTLVPERAAPHLRLTADIRLLDPPVEVPTFTEVLWWHPRRTTDPAHSWIRQQLIEIASQYVAG
ncbi:MAG: LysR family transcriptional regulator [Solirubrobacteraceae bacterium]